MTIETSSGFEQDIAGQPQALQAFAATELPREITSINFTSFDRIILTGMGSSDYVTIPLELEFARAGLPIWRIQTNRLLEMPQLITRQSLLWITSQSGRSGEVIALLESLGAPRRPTIVATTNDRSSPLALGADSVIALHCGTENTVSCKSYLNSLAAIHRLVAVFREKAEALARDEILNTARALEVALRSPATDAQTVASDSLTCNNPRFALVGTGADGATALTGALIMKEAAKVAAEGYIGGEFRHGPMELAGAGLTTLLFGSGPDETLERLAVELAQSGSNVLAISPVPYAGARHIAVPAEEFGRLAQSMIFIQRLSVALAKARGLTPGEFRFGKKITAQL